jgi:hypothetical protein
MILSGTLNLQTIDDEFDRRLLVDFDHRGHFRPLGEFVDGEIEILLPSDGPRD